MGHYLLERVRTLTTWNTWKYWIIFAKVIWRRSYFAQGVDRICFTFILHPIHIDQSLVLEPHLSSICSSSSKCGYQLLIFFSVGYPPGSTKMVNMDHDWRWISYWKWGIYHCHVIILPPQTMHYHFREIPPKNYQQHLHQVWSCLYNSPKKNHQKFHQKVSPQKMGKPTKKFHLIRLFLGVGFPLQKPYPYSYPPWHVDEVPMPSRPPLSPVYDGSCAWCVLENEVI